MAEFTSCGMYIQSTTVLSERIARCDEIIDALEAAILEAAGNPAQTNFTEYQIDTGQTKISTGYRSIGEMAMGLDAIELMKNRYVNKLNGHVFRLVDSKNFPRH